MERVSNGITHNGVGPRQNGIVSSKAPLKCSTASNNPPSVINPTILLIVRYGIFKPFLATIWTVTHFIYTLIHNIGVFHLFKSLISSWKNSRNDIVMLTKTDQFEKFPKHLVIAVHNNDESLHNLNQMIKIICWAWVSNVKVVSLYEPKGILKSQTKKLRVLVEKALLETCKILKDAGVSGPKTTPPIIKFYNSGVQETEKLENETTSEKLVQETLPIFMCCEKDCKSGIVNAARNLFEKKANAKPTLSLPEALLNKDLDAETFTNAINEEIGWPVSSVEANSEPDLMMVFGNVKSTIGFLPWHIRLTEIHWLPPIPKIRVIDFFNSLQKYSQCEQRVGK